MAMDIEQIKTLLAKPIAKLTAGGFRPTYQETESWLGKVSLFAPGEAIPLDDAGKPMLPLAQLCIPALPVISPRLADTRLLTVFISATLPEPFEAMGANWLVREYGHGDLLIRQDFLPQGPSLKAFPLQAERIDEDYPLWDSGDIPLELESEILRQEKAGKIAGYYDLTCHTYTHKIGGYPSYCQSGVDLGEGFEFVFQIASDSKIHLNIIDNGCLMFWKHKTTGQWALYYDFY
ncbi:DUF1963 domain-containing protein [Chromobacterium subtsugae]|uniref:DUF1963 domain-containing protein n=2 Tax=Chromobacterium subtsugae TaxID=251747 RepID=A0ABS7FCZ6_9NEIS|nr:DUF1963 domain-containing protein [Chromobacterium sp. F49]MBW8287958.1 DUF1963 domain-containing protein [Chromobacterium subtsugae]